MLNGLAQKRSRATMWDVPRFAEYHSYEIIIVENVVDARYWVQRGAWLLAMHLLGYAQALALSRALNGLVVVVGNWLVLLAGCWLLLTSKGDK
ncbi:MAG: hypothetical protein JNJ65_00065 [Cyclobacteriaceae bacterium]|nr:hypothetical protein [Cyclobacteriaceae bacterium]